MLKGLCQLLLTRIAGAAESASVKQIMHMSSASCLSTSWSSVRHRLRHGRHSNSLFIPPHTWPQDNVLLQALAAYSCGEKTKIKVQINVMYKWWDEVNVVFLSYFLTLLSYCYIWRSVSIAGGSDCSWKWTNNLLLATDNYLSSRIWTTVETSRFKAKTPSLIGHRGPMFKTII